MTTRADLSNAAWGRSSYSNAEGGNCAGVARDVPRVVPVRDSKRTADGGPVLLFPAPGWEAFLRAVQPGRL